MRLVLTLDGPAMIASWGMNASGDQNRLRSRASRPIQALALLTASTNAGPTDPLMTKEVGAARTASASGVSVNAIRRPPPRPLRIVDRTSAPPPT